MLDRTRSQAWFEAFHATQPAGRFCIFHPAQGPLRGQMLYIHPFAEELNRSRRMASLQSRQFAQAGFEVLQIDLHGCGDSPGEFGDASWNSWLADIAAAAGWLRARHQEQEREQLRPPLWLWGLRLGCVLAVEAARRHALHCNFLFWQPLAGPSQLQQLLRLGQAGQILAQGGDQAGDHGAIARLRDALDRGQSVQISGYEVSAALAQGMAASELMEAPAGTGKLCWIEISPSTGQMPSPQASQVQQSWQAAGVELLGRHVCGPAFWQMLEPPDLPDLLDISLAVLNAAASAGGSP